MNGLKIIGHNRFLPQIILGLILVFLTVRQSTSMEFAAVSQDAVASEDFTHSPQVSQLTYQIEEYYINTQTPTPNQPREYPQVFNPTLRGVGPAYRVHASVPIESSDLNLDFESAADMPTSQDHPHDHQFDQELLQLAFPTAISNSLYTERPALYPVPWAPTPFDHFYFSRPIAANHSAWAYPDYRYGGVYFPGVVHTGVDMQAKMKTPILAAASGRVTWAGYGASTGTVNKEDPYGLAVIIRHDFGWQGKNLYTLYAHLDQVDVSRGQYIQTGTRLGLSGNTGNSTGPHLHFEVLLQDKGRFSSYNPELWLVPPQGWGVLVGRVMYTGGSLLEGQLVTVRSLETSDTFRGHTYHRGPVNSDPYYQENLVISDIPAGLYEIRIDHLGRRHLLTIEIKPGQVTYFTFLGRGGFGLELPLAPGNDFVPQFTP